MEDDPLAEYRIDGLTNVLTGMGIAGHDKLTGVGLDATYILGAAELEELYMNGLMRRYVDAIPNTIISNPPTITLGGDVDPDDDTVQRVEQYIQDNELTYVFAEQMRLQRLYGGGGIVMIINDGRDAAEPVNVRNIRGIKFVALSSEELTPDDKAYIDVSKPTHYILNTFKKVDEDEARRPGTISIHHTRVARFDGLYLPWRSRQATYGWGLSCLQPLWDALVIYESAIKGLSNVQASGDILTHRMPGLINRIAAGQEELLIKRLELHKLSMSNYKTILLDSEEEMKNLSRNLSNMASATEPFVEYLQAVTGWPSSILMGKSPGGLGKEGRFEERVWAGINTEWQEA